MPPDLLAEVVSILIPHMQTENQRQAILTLALPETARDQVNLSGAPRTFVVNMVQKLQAFGDVSPGTPAIVAVLDVVAGQVGIDGQARIARLREQLVVPPPPPATGHAPLGSISAHYRAQQGIALTTPASAGSQRLGSIAAGWSKPLTDTEYQALVRLLTPHLRTLDDRRHWLQYAFPNEPDLYADLNFDATPPSRFVTNLCTHLRQNRPQTKDGHSSLNVLLRAMHHADPQSQLGRDLQPFVNRLRP